MYRQGLGDCFLLTFPGRERESHLLIDFGVLLGTEDAKRTMRQIAHQIVEATGGRLDVLVATHEHWDHVSGFMQAEDLLGPDKLRSATCGSRGLRSRAIPSRWRWISAGLAH